MNDGYDYHVDDVPDEVDTGPDRNRGKKFQLLRMMSDMKKRILQILTYSIHTGPQQAKHFVTVQQHIVKIWPLPKLGKRNSTKLLLGYHEPDINLKVES